MKNYLKKSKMFTKRKWLNIQRVRKSILWICSIVIRDSIPAISDNCEKWIVIDVKARYELILHTKGDWLNSWSLFCYTFWLLAARKESPCQSFYHMKFEWLLHNSFRRMPPSAIGKELGKDRTTISRKTKNYSYDKKSNRPIYPYNPCKFHITCKAKKLSGTNCT